MFVALKLKHRIHLQTGTPIGRKKEGMKQRNIIYMLTKGHRAYNVRTIKHSDKEGKLNCNALEHK